jgi:hypothetical protein
MRPGPQPLPEPPSREAQAIAASIKHQRVEDGSTIDRGPRTTRNVASGPGATAAREHGGRGRSAGRRVEDSRAAPRHLAGSAALRWLMATNNRLLGRIPRAIPPLTGRTTYRRSSAACCRLERSRNSHGSGLTVGLPLPAARMTLTCTLQGAAESDALFPFQRSSPSSTPTRAQSRSRPPPLADRARHQRPFLCRGLSLRGAVGRPPLCSTAPR